MVRGRLVMRVGIIDRFTVVGAMDVCGAALRMSYVKSVTVE